MPEAKPSRFALIILATICITYIVENFLRSTAGALTPVLMAELGVSYGALVDSTGSYFTSNRLMLVGAFLVPLLMTGVDESYGGIKKKLAAPQIIR